MANLHPKGVNHLAIATRDMKAQLSFWTDVMGCPMVSLYHMHGVDGAYHGFVELSPYSYVAFVFHPDNPKEAVKGVSHAGNGVSPVTAGATQHIALHVDTFEDVLEMRDRIRSRGVHAIGPVDHGFCKSIYFAGPEGLSLEVCCGDHIDPRQWIDEEVVASCGISADELAAMKAPAAFEKPDEPVPQPPVDTHPDAPRMMYSERAYAKLMTMADEFIWETMSEPEPPNPIP